MKHLNGKFKLLIVSVLVTMICAFLGCDLQSPLSEIEDDARKPASNKQLHFIPLGNGKTSFNKIISVSELVTVEDGGELILEYKGYEHNNGDVELKITFKVFSNTISEDAVLKLTLDDSLLVANVDVNFYPHGITFSQPALLNIEAKNLDLTNVNSDSVSLYYDNTVNNSWEEMNTKEVIVKSWEGYIKVIDGELAHFSRYAVAFSR